MATFQQFLAQQGLQFNGGFLNFSYVDTLTAHAGGGQGSATVLTAQVNRISVCATAGDSVVLPTAAAMAISPNGPQDRKGAEITVINSGAASLNVFGATGDTINGGSANGSVSVPSGATATFRCVTDGSWFTGIAASTSFNNLTLSGYLFESSAVAITAGTTRTQGGATVLAKEVNRVDTSTAPSAGTYLGDGVALPAAAAGLTLMVWNNTANVIQLYGNGSDTVNGVAGATGIPVPPNAVFLAIAASTVSWTVDGTAMGNSGGYATQTSVNALTAHAGGGQGSALLLPAMMNRVTTVGSAADSVLLPVSAQGMDITVTNAAASNSMNVFPQSGDAINALGANTAFAVAAGKTASFYCYNAGQWHSILSA